MIPQDLSMYATKTCSKCKIEKILAIDFYDDSTGWCRACAREADRKRRLKSGCDPKLAWKRRKFNAGSKKKPEQYTW
jgi:hypothetical protein